MRKLDRLVWADGIAFNAYGLRIGIRVDKAWALEPLMKALPFGATLAKRPYVDYLYSIIVAGGDGPHPRRFNLIYGDAFRIGKSERFDDIVEAMEQEISLFIGEMSKNRIFIHSGVVGWKGRAILLPGPTRSGKSTMVAALVRAGARYYSDEFAVIDEKGRVHPFARPLALRQEGDLRGQPVDITAFGGREGRTPLQVGAIVFAPYAKGSAWKPEAISSGQALLGLLENTLSARSHPERALDVLGTLTQAAACFYSERGDADPVAVRVLNLVESHATCID